ncbi:MAG: general secretion pathway protein GspB [Actinomycetota bacterium]
MSYILDALVKADQERQRQAVPGLHTVQAGLPVVPVFQRRWPLGAAGAVLAVGVVALAWNRPGHGPTPAASAPESLRERPAAAAPLATPPAEAPRPVMPIIVAPPSRPLPTLREAAPQRALEAAEAKAPRPGTRLYAIAELPPALQEEARKIRVAGFAQGSGDDQRLAIINDRAWREGDEVTTGLRVERISNDGVIFNLKGYRFRKGAA